MTPNARVAAAIEILDTIIDGMPAEKTLTNWGRSHRFAGSSDRRAIRDLVFDVVRRRRSYGWLGGSDAGRGLMIGRLRAVSAELTQVFTGGRYDPAPLSKAEAVPPPSLAEATDPVRLDCLDWIWSTLRESQGDKAEAILATMQRRAPVFLRVNSARISRAGATQALADEAIETKLHSLSLSALEVIQNSRRVHLSASYLDGLVELQDVSAQAVVDVLMPFAKAKSVLDYCAGGGGKSLALAAGGAGRIVAYDANPGRMSDIPARANRAGAVIEIAEKPAGLFDVVLCDAPCSGSGAWRRQPEAKWLLTSDTLESLTELQDRILDDATDHVAARGVLAYSTCSLFRAENEDRISAFLKRKPAWEKLAEKSLTPLDGGDGFFITILGRTASL